MPVHQFWFKGDDGRLFTTLYFANLLANLPKSKGSVMATSRGAGTF